MRQIVGVNGETDFEVLHRKSEDDMVGIIQQKPGNHRRAGSDGVGGGGEAGERGSQKVEVGLLLAMDYSGMDELEQGQAALDDTALLAGVDGQVSDNPRMSRYQYCLTTSHAHRPAEQRNAPTPKHPTTPTIHHFDTPTPNTPSPHHPQARMALKAQITRSKSRDDMCTAIHIFRDLLGLGLHLPRPAAVETKQALKDAARESIKVQGVLFASDCEGVQGALKEAIEPLSSDSGLVDSVCSDILRAASRTASGGDSYTVVRAMLATDDSPLTPAPVKQAPILIEVDADSGKVHIETEGQCSCLSACTVLGHEVGHGVGQCSSSCTWA